MKKNISNKQQYFFNIEEMKKKENEALQILIENIDSPYSFLFFKNSIIFTNDYLHTLNLIKESNSVWNRFQNLMDNNCNEKDY